MTKSYKIYTVTDNANNRVVYVGLTLQTVMERRRQILTNANELCEVQPRLCKKSVPADLQNLINLSRAGHRLKFKLLETFRGTYLEAHKREKALKKELIHSF